MNPPGLEFLFTLTAEVGDIVTMGAGAARRAPRGADHRRHASKVRRCAALIGGADWQIVRDDGAIELDARYAIKEARGGIVQVVSQGMRHGPPEVLARLGRGEDVAPGEYFFRTIMRFETGASELAFLNKTIAVATAERKARRVELQAWRLL